uniref:Uncharacterized protein n=1 Tax=Colobus angolensis palliatus TaxID=336983 RepID=A0A2K5IV18_COLAP
MASPITEPVGKPGTQWRGCSGHPQPSALRQGLKQPGDLGALPLPAPQPSASTCLRRETLARVEVASRKGRCCWGFPSPHSLVFLCLYLLCFINETFITLHHGECLFSLETN